MTSTPTVLGSAPFSYQLDTAWAKMPAGWTFLEVAAIGIDSKDRVYVFSRGAHPVIVFGQDGSFIRSWGEGLFPRPHGITMAPDDTLYLTDDGDHTVKHCNPEGKVLMTIGVPNKPSVYMSGQPFHRCTHLAIEPHSGDLFITDGYGNAHVHRYTAKGKYLSTFGASGIGPGEFNLPHNIVAANNLLYVADRENHRIQAFDTQGNFHFAWTNVVHRPCALCTATDGNFYVGELGPALPINKDAPNLGPRVSILNDRGHLLARLGDLHGGDAPGQFIAPHGIAVDSRGDIYVGEVSWTVAGKNLTPPRELRSLQKLVRKPNAH